MIQLFRGDLYDKFGEQRLSLYQECVVPEDIHIPMEGNRIPRGGGVQKEAISKGVGGGGVRVTLLILELSLTCLEIRQ